jgi:hypothetical protein
LNHQIHTKDQSSNRKYDHSLSVQNQENEEKDGGIFSRQSYVDKTSPHGGATSNSYHFSSNGFLQ